MLLSLFKKNPKIEDSDMIGRLGMKIPKEVPRQQTSTAFSSTSEGLTADFFGISFITKESKKKFLDAAISFLLIFWIPVAVVLYAIASSK